MFVRVMELMLTNSAVVRYGGQQSKNDWGDSDGAKGFGFGGCVGGDDGGDGCAGRREGTGAGTGSDSGFACDAAGPGSDAAEADATAAREPEPGRGGFERSGAAGGSAVRIKEQSRAGDVSAAASGDCAEPGVLAVFESAHPAAGAISDSGAEAGFGGAAGFER